MASHTFTWTEEGRTHDLPIRVPPRAYERARSTPRGASNEGYLALATHPFILQRLAPIVQRILGVSPQPGTTNGVVARISAFVQGIPYESYREDAPGTPLETLTTGRGICRDTAILLGALLRAADVRSVLIFYEPRAPGGAGHVAVGVPWRGRQTGTAYEIQGQRYWYVETTSHAPIGWASKYSREADDVRPVEPLPVLAHHGSYHVRGDTWERRLTIANLGSRPACKVRVMTGIRNGAEGWWGPRTTRWKTLAPLSKRTLSHTSRVPRGVHAPSLMVKTWAEGVPAVCSESE